MKKIAESLSSELAGVDAILCETLDSESSLIREVGDYVSFTRGKKLRPMLNLLMAKSMGPRRRAPIEVAAALELIHVATLLHDDVIDRATVRRGKPSVNARWGDAVAILMADYLYARAFDLALSSLRPEVMRVFTRVTQKMCEGEMFQIESRERALSMKEYLHVIQRKTGSLFSACTSLGMLLAGGSDEDISNAGAFGFDFGIAFQITDDALDFAAHDQQWGKNIGMDVSSGQQTLPLILALGEASEQDRRSIETWMQNGRDFHEIFETIQRYNGVERALEHAHRYAEQASSTLELLKPADLETFESLAALPEYVIGRAY